MRGKTGRNIAGKTEKIGRITMMTTGITGITTGTAIMGDGEPLVPELL
jgi:hypothetical protein